MQSRHSKAQVQKDDNSLSQILSGYLSYWPLFLICLFLAFGIAYFYIRYAVPKYEASATIIIKDERKGDKDSKLIEEIDAISSKKIIENETEVLQSRILMAEVAKKLLLYAPIIREGEFRYQSAYHFTPVVAEVRNPDAIRKASDQILLSYDSTTKQVSLNNKKVGVINEWLNTAYGEVKFIPNPNYIAPNEKEKKPIYLSFIPVSNVASQLAGGLKVSATSKLSSVLVLSYADEIPQRAEQVLNALIANYSKASVEEKNDLVKNTLASIDYRLNVVAKDLDSIERRIQQYRASTKAIDLGAQSNLYLQSVGNSDAELGKVDVQMSNLNQLENFVKSNESIGVLPSAIGVNDPALTGLMTDLNNAQINYDKMKKTVGENNPMLTSIKDQINKLKPDILSNIQTQKRNLAETRQNLYSTSGKYNSMLNNIPQKEKQLVEISRDQNIKNGIYQFLLQKREESQLSYANNIPDNKIVNYALANRSPVSPKKTLIYIAALLFGLLTPLVLVNAREMLNSKILYRKEIESLTSIPVIGEIVQNKSKDSVVIEPGKRTFIAEEFRKIRVSLMFLGIDSYHKKILVTSSIPGEGKSFVAANLAISLAMTGKKVALVDMDLHNPSLGKLFNVTTEEIGVSDYLLGEKDADEIIRTIPNHDNLFFISSGGLHPTPSELLENGQIQKLINFLEENFDVVVLDTAPVVMVTDAYHLSSLTDATLYVIRHKYTPKMLVKRIDENNKINTLKNPAIIFNGIKTRGFVKNNYGYGYDYVYGGNQKKFKETNVKA